MTRLFETIHEDPDLLVVNKPAGLVCHPTKGDEYSSLISRARLHVGAETEVHLINRLDRETSGVVVIAKNGEAASILRRQWENRTVSKEYLAMVHGRVLRAHDHIVAPLGRDSESRIAIKDCVRLDGADAHTEFMVLEHFRRDAKEFTLLKVWLHTGRKHQIRIHLAYYGHAIIGDKIYGGDEECYLDFVLGRLKPEQSRELILPFHALHAARVRLHWKEIEATFSASPEPWFDEFHRQSEPLPRE